MMDEKRRFTRIPLELRVQAFYPDLDGVVAAHTLDVSRGGLFVALSAPRPVGTIVHIAFKLDSPPIQLDLEGMIVRVMARDDKPLVGVEILRPISEWERFCEMLEAHRAAAGRGPGDQ